MPKLASALGWRLLPALLLACRLSADSGPQVHTFRSPIDSSDQPYALYVPPDYDPARPWPLIVSLHAEGSNHRLNLRRVFGIPNLPGETDFEASRRWPPLKPIGYFVASPLARGTMGYQGIPEQDIDDMLADVTRRYRIDPDRLYLTGISSGGGGALWLALTRPDRWAAVAVVAPRPPAGTEERIPNALGLPIHLFHGEADPLVPASGIRRWHKQLLDSGARAEYVEIPGMRHNSWEYAYQDAKLLDWFARHRRPAHPTHIRFTTDAYRYSRAWWLTLDRLTPGVFATVEARLEPRNRLTLTTSQSDALHLDLSGHPGWNPRLPGTLQIDQTRISLRPGTRIAVERNASRWVLLPSPAAPASSAKRPGLEGPIREAVRSRHLYVYGTADRPSEDELRRRQALAQQAAEWAGPDSRLLLTFRVLSDEEVSDADLRESNLVLFGTRQTNALVARFASHFPLELNAGAADLGLLFVAPLPTGRYALVSSGLPWWSPDERSASRTLAAPALALDRLGDYLVYKGSPRNVIASGRFTQRWQVPPDDADRLRQTGAVALP